MKLKMYFIMLALGLFSFAMQSCDDDDEDAPVSEQLEKAFINEFGNVAHNWSTRGTNHVASFNQDNTEKEAWFDANGVWLMTETDIAYDALPAPVKQAFEALTQYEGWKRDDVDMLERKGMEKVYVIEIEKGKEELNLFFDVNGNLLKEVADKETLSRILCKWKQDSVVSLFLYLDSVFKNKHKLIHNQAPVMNRLCPFLLNLHK